MIDITKYLNQTVTHKQQNGNDEYGVPSYSSGSDIAARFLTTSKRTTDTLGVIGERGAEVTIDAEAWVEPDITITPKDTIDYDGETYMVVRAYEPRSRPGNVNHVKLELGRTKQ